MPFQNQVYLRAPSGYPGDWCSDNIYYAAALIAGEGGVIPGNFVSVVTPANTNVDVLNPKRAVNGGDNAIGIALRSRIGVIKSVKDEAVFNIDEGYPVEAVVDGDCRVALSNYASAAEGMKVFYNVAEIPAAGGGPAIPAGTPYAAAAGSTVAGYVETPWYVYGLTAFEGDNMAKISTYRRG